MSMNGIDISGWQSGIDIAALSQVDFVIVKATGGTSFVSDDFRRQAQQVLDSGKCLGIYHYARERGCAGSAAAEARHFINQVKHIKGSFVPALDVEADALDLPATWSREFMDIVAAELGATPVLYTGASAVNNKNWHEVASKYPLWMASYYSRYAGRGFDPNPTCGWGTGAWDKMTIYQYTSEGRIRGYNGNLDLNKFYGSREDWAKLCGKKPEQVPGTPFNKEGLRYRAHVQNIGWCDWVRDGQTAGTTGYSMRLEGLNIDPPEGWELEVKAHLQGLGWRTYPGIVHGNDILIGSVGESRRIEMLSIEVVKAPKGSSGIVHFQVHQQNVGWKGWTESGYFSGSDGQSKRLEAVRMRVSK